MPKRKLHDPGNVVEISLPNGCYAYGIVIERPLTAFTGVYNTKQYNYQKLLDNIRFKIWIMKYSIGKNGWPVVSNVAINDDLKNNTFYKYDVISKKIIFMLIA